MSKIPQMHVQEIQRLQNEIKEMEKDWHNRYGIGADATELANLRREIDYKWIQLKNLIKHG